MQFLRCDTADCSYFKPVNKITADMVDEKCPDCGESLLTQEDYDLFVVALNEQPQTDGAGVLHVHKGVVTTTTLNENTTNQTKQGNK